MTEREDAIDLLHRAAECTDKGENTRALINMQAAATLIQWESERGAVDGRNGGKPPDNFRFTDAEESPDVGE